MARSQLFEFIDLPWYPSALRDLQTDMLRHGLGPAFVEVAPLIQRTLQRAGASRVLDLCSGAGGPWPRLRLALDGPEAPASVTLSDRYPNATRLERLCAESGGLLEFIAEPVDARAPPVRPAAMRTMFAAFHHFPPAEAQAVLRGARDDGVAIAVFDVGSARSDARALIRTATFLVIAPLVFLLTYWLVTPRLGPLTWPRVLFTYLIPIVPLVTVWDFAVSAWRAYTLRELQAMVRELATNDYAWEVGERGTPSMPIFYILGHPVGDS
ncbi:MAG: class I SAM-dependent methyltransferase [Myxococcales bacterium]|nr:class I SAM-dependent methyltransferase [Myxococcales bacterium]